MHKHGPSLHRLSLSCSLQQGGARCINMGPALHRLSLSCSLQHLNNILSMYGFFMVFLNNYIPKQMCSKYALHSYTWAIFTQTVFVL